MVYLSGAGLPRLSWKKRPLNGCSVVVVVVVDQKIFVRIFHFFQEKPFLALIPIIINNNIDVTVVCNDVDADRKCLACAECFVSTARLPVG